MKSEGLIKGFLPGEVKTKLLKQSDYFYEDKLKFVSELKNDPDYGNDGIIFISGIQHYKYCKTADGNRYILATDGKYYTYQEKPSSGLLDFSILLKRL